MNTNPLHLTRLTYAEAGTMVPLPPCGTKFSPCEDLSVKRRGPSTRDPRGGHITEKGSNELANSQQDPLTPINLPDAAIRYSLIHRTNEVQGGRGTTLDRKSQLAPHHRQSTLAALREATPTQGTPLLGPLPPRLSHKRYSAGRKSPPHCNIRLEQIRIWMDLEFRNLGSPAIFALVFRNSRHFLPE